MCGAQAPETYAVFQELLFSWNNVPVDYESRNTLSEVLLTFNSHFA